MSLLLDCRNLKFKAKVPSNHGRSDLLCLVFGLLSLLLEELFLRSIQRDQLDSWLVDLAGETEWRLVYLFSIFSHRSRRVRYAAVLILQKQEDLIGTSAQAAEISRRCSMILASACLPRRIRHS